MKQLTNRKNAILFLALKHYSIFKTIEDEVVNA